MAPMEVAVASANRALSILEEAGTAFHGLFVFRAEDARATAGSNKGPMVSNVSDRLKAKIVIRTRGILLASENKDPSPSLVNMTPKVVGSTETASVKLIVSPVAVSPMGMPISAVMIMLKSIALFEFQKGEYNCQHLSRSGTTTEQVCQGCNAGTPASKLMKPTLSSPI